MPTFKIRKAKAQTGPYQGTNVFDSRVMADYLPDNRTVQVCVVAGFDPPACVYVPITEWDKLAA